VSGTQLNAQHTPCNARDSWETFQQECSRSLFSADHASQAATRENTTQAIAKHLLVREMPYMLLRVNPAAASGPAQKQAYMSCIDLYLDNRVQVTETQYAIADNAREIA
jgi:hypothetical protein